jgi:hypothetical protein
MLENLKLDMARTNLCNPSLTGNSFGTRMVRVALNRDLD